MKIRESQGQPILISGGWVWGAVPKAQKAHLWVASDDITYVIGPRLLGPGAESEPVILTILYVSSKAFESPPLLSQ